MIFEFENELQPVLSKGERLLWTGRPKQGFALRPADAFVIPFSLFWLGFALFWIYGAQKASHIFALLGIPFVLIGLYLVVGRFIWDIIKRKNTIYGITDSRVIIKTGGFSSTTNSINIKNLPDIGLREKNDGSGTITLGQPGFQNSYSTFNDPAYRRGTRMPPSLEMIENVRQAYDILIEQQRKQG